MVTFILRLVANDTKKYASDHPIIFRTDNKGELETYIKNNYPTAKKLPVMSEERKRFFSGSFKPYLYLIETPLHRHSYITEYSI